MRSPGFPGSTFQKYMLLRICAPLFMALFVILAALSLERLLRLIEVLTTQNAPFSFALKLLIYLQPHYLGLALPAALFLSIILAVRQMSEHSELVVMQAAGIPYRKLLIPIISLALFMTFIMFILTGAAQPYGRYFYRSAVQDIKTNGQILRIQPQEFVSLSDNITLRVEAVGNRGRLFKGFFAEQISETGSKTIATSQNAEIIEQTASESASEETVLHLTLNNARILIIPEDDDPEIITTQSYPLKLSIGPAKAYGSRGQERRELTYGELLAGGAENVIPEDSFPAMRAEFHYRAVQTLSLPVLCVLAIALGLIGSGRTGKAAGFILGVILLVLYQKTLGFVESFASRGALPAGLAIWTPWFILLFGTFLFFAKMTGFEARRWKLAWFSKGKDNGS